MRNRDSKERTKSWGRGLGIEGSQIIRNSFFFLNQCVSQSELVRRAIITQRKLGICCKFRWEFYPKTSFFSLVQFCMKVWLMIGLGMDIRYLTLKGETFPPNPSPLKWREKKILYPIIRAWADKLAPLFFFFPLQPPFYFLLEIRLQTWVTIHKYLVVLCCKELRGKNPEEGNS